MTDLRFSRRTFLGSVGAGVLTTVGGTAFAAPVTLEALKKAGEVKVGCEAAYVPFTYRDNSGKIMDSIGAAKQSGDISKQEAGQLTKDHLQQQIDGGPE